MLWNAQCRRHGNISKFQQSGGKDLTGIIFFCPFVGVYVKEIITSGA